MVRETLAVGVTDGRREVARGHETRKMNVSERVEAGEPAER
jgi:hypothetical protein